MGRRAAAQQRREQQGKHSCPTPPGAQWGACNACMVLSRESPKELMHHRMAA